MGRPLNKKFFGDGASPKIRCDAEVDGSGVELCFIVSQRSNSRYLVQTEASFASDALVIGVQYIIVTVGSGTWADAGASSEAIGTVFTATATTNGDSDGTADARAICKLVQGEPLAIGEMQVEISPELFASGAEADIEYSTSDLALITQGQDEGDYASAFTAGTNYMGGITSDNYTNGLVITTGPNVITRDDGATFTDDDIGVGQKLVITNAEDGANNGTFTITVVTATAITVTETLVANADDDTMTLAVFDVITLDDGSVVTVDAAGTAGTPAAVTQFTVTTADATPLAETTVRAQSSVSGAIAAGFNITPDDANEIPRGVVTAVAFIDPANGGSGYFIPGTFNITTSTDGRFVAGTEAVISFTVNDAQEMAVVAVQSGGDGYQAETDLAINTNDIPDSAAAGSEESAKVIKGRTVTTFEGNIYMWPAAGAPGSSKVRNEADLGRQ